MYTILRAMLATGFALSFSFLAFAQIPTTIVVSQETAMLDLGTISGKKILTMDSGVQRAQYTRYFFDPAEWVAKVGSTDSLPGVLSLEIMVSERIPGATYHPKSGAAPTGGIGFRDYDASIIMRRSDTARLAMENEGFIPLQMVKGGTFTIGSPAKEIRRRTDEDQRSVTLSDFMLAKTEVTQAQYNEVMQENPSKFQDGYEAPFRPVDTVSWHTALVFCNRLSQKESLNPVYYADSSFRTPYVGGPTVYWKRSADGYRLPTEAEWEYACRAGTTTRFFTGEDIGPHQANNSGSSPWKASERRVERESTMAVASFEPNKWGLYDMVGNVSEWCWDYYEGSYPAKPEKDPTGPVQPTIGQFYISRGGSWSGNEWPLLRSADRNYSNPQSPSAINGFRVARSIVQ